MVVLSRRIELAATSAFMRKELYSLYTGWALIIILGVLACEIRLTLDLLLCCLSGRLLRFLIQLCLLSRADWTR